ncbi:MAG: DNA mismatch repair endonuclease MutL, partial [Oscillospiraceae bacterium]
ATSKVLVQEDLENINTLGFRGEALASVSAVSRIEMITKRPEDALGSSYIIEGGEPSEYDRTGCADGTTIIIRDLFYNTPARLKFLKKDVTEGNYCQNVVEKLALSHPNISFKFIRDGKQTIFTSGDGDYYNAVYSVYGKQFAAGMIPVETIYRDIGVTGFVSSPLFTRANRTMQVFFVNGRSVKSPLCCAALEEGFRNSIMVGKFPACVLNINLNPAFLDANISPAKTEVRFSEEKSVFDAIYIAVKNALLGFNESREIQLPNANDISGRESHASTVTIPSGTAVASAVPSATVVSAANVNAVSASPNVSPTAQEEKTEKSEAVIAYSEPTTPKTTTEIISEYNRKRTEATPASIPFEISKGEQQVMTEVLPPLLKEESSEPKMEEQDLSGFEFLSKKSFEKSEPKNEEKAENTEYVTPVSERVEEPKQEIRVIGELFKTYILCESGDSMVLIDKHAAHERINFERFKRGQNLHGQLLIEPCEVFLSPEEYEAVRAFNVRLENIGLILKFQDNGKVMVEGVPQSLEDTDPAELIQSITQILVNGDDNAEGALFDDVLHSMACKASIRANEVQSISELAYLANIVFNDRNIRYCPHGRPVMTQISKKQIEKYFGRIV